MDGGVHRRGGRWAPFATCWGIALDGRGAFRRLTDVLLDYLAEREAWFALRGGRVRAAARVAGGERHRGDDRAGAQEAMTLVRSPTHGSMRVCKRSREIRVNRDRTGTRIPTWKTRTRPALTSPSLVDDVGATDGCGRSSAYER